MENKVEPRTLPGTMELLPQEQIIFNSYMDKIKNSYESFGYLPLDTPILELSEVLLAKAGGETEKQIYRFSKGDTDLAMRFDLTVPLARYVSKHYNELQFPFKRYQIGKVYRGERPQKGRYREFYQCDIDVIGEDNLSILADAEMVAVIYNTFKSLDIGEFKIHINNRKILSGLFEYLNITTGPIEILRVVDKLLKIGENKVLEELEEIGVKHDFGIRILEFLKSSDDINSIVKHLKNFEAYGVNETYTVGVDELNNVILGVEAANIPTTYYEIDLTIARGLDYYTGTVYETFLTNYENIGSVCSGGRYDNLASYYTDKKMPGVGVAIGLTRLFYVLQELGIIKSYDMNDSDVIIIPMAGYEHEAIKLASMLRENKVKTQTYLGDKKLKGQLKYADKLGITYAIVIGENEVINKEYNVKNMKTGQSEFVTYEKLCKYLLGACKNN